MHGGSLPSGLPSPCLPSGCEGKSGCPCQHGPDTHSVHTDLQAARSEKGNWTQEPGVLELRGGSSWPGTGQFDFKALSGPKFLQNVKKEGKRKKVEITH